MCLNWESWSRLLRTCKYTTLFWREWLSWSLSASARVKGRFCFPDPVYSHRCRFAEGGGSSQSERQSSHLFISCMIYACIEAKFPDSVLPELTLMPISNCFARRKGFEPSYRYHDATELIGSISVCAGNLAGLRGGIP